MLFSIMAIALQRLRSKYGEVGNGIWYSESRIVAHTHSHRIHLEGIEPIHCNIQTQGLRSG